MYDALQKACRWRNELRKIPTFAPIANSRDGREKGGERRNGAKVASIICLSFMITMMTSQQKLKDEHYLSNTDPTFWYLYMHCIKSILQNLSLKGYSGVQVLNALCFVHPILHLQ